MKNIFFLTFCFLSIAASAQTADLPAAEAQAKKEGKLILLEFSGSDWCIPCIRLEKEVFSQEPFQSYAADHLVVLKADFPRLKKHQLSEGQKHQNEALAETYNPNGAFPFVVLLDADGKVLKSWEGAAFNSTETFITQVNPYVPAR